MELKRAVLLNAEASRRDGKPFTARLACGFTPLSLSTFLSAHIAERVEDRPISITSGLYGDLEGSIGADGDPDVLLVIVELQDLDPRFGLRRSGGWTADALEDAGSSAHTRLHALKDRIRQRAHPRCVVMLPTIAPPPLFSTGAWQASLLELRLQSDLASFAYEIASIPGVVVCDRVHAGDTDGRNPNSDLIADFPYSNQHADVVAAALVKAAVPPVPLKGIITDLDDTLWRGIVGDVGASGVAWNLDARAQVHALYQMLLNALAERGILIAIASKNDPANVAEALKRSDLLIDTSRIYPIEASWNAKSLAVGRILKTWNIGEDAVLFVDDSPLEIAEVQSVFPRMRCERFPTSKDADVYGLLQQIRDLFHREKTTDEDALRLASIKNAAQREQEVATATSSEDFIRSIRAELQIDSDVAPGDQRPFELVNKTNQFNLNGRRLGAADWSRLLEDTDGFVRVGSYSDKFGPLGKIAVLFGRRENRSAKISGWVLSCRAFSRQVEYAMLQDLFDSLDVDTVCFDYESTEKNGPVLSFLQALGVADGSPFDRRKLAGLPEVLISVKALSVA